MAADTPERNAAYWNAQAAAGERWSDAGLALDALTALYIATLAEKPS